MCLRPLFCAKLIVFLYRRLFGLPQSKKEVRVRQSFRLWQVVVCAWACCAPGLLFAQSQPLPSDPELDDILSHDIADLTVTSVSRRPQKLSSAASAIYVVTKEDIERTGASSVAEVLRIVPGLQVAQVSSHNWAISARGFDSSLANKMLVMIDGRSLYTPVFSGTYWDDRQIPVTEVERIEVIRGPGASVWGANAVNGIINIITKSGKDEQGNYVTARAGTEEASLAAGRGKEYAPDQYYRTYAQGAEYGATKAPGGSDNNDAWNRVEAGFRVDGKTGNDDGYMLSGQGYGGGQESRQVGRLRDAPFSYVYDTDDTSYGGSFSGTWDHAFSADSNGTLKTSIDSYKRDEFIADQDVTTFDIDWQRDTQTSARNNLIWGVGYRFFSVGINGSFDARVRDTQADYSLFSGFLQDEYQLVPNELYLTLGSKLEHNDFTGFEVQPTARLSWVVDDKQTVWGAVSRAVRTPSIVDHDINLIALTAPGPTYTVLFGSSDIASEELIAYELGYRLQATPKLQFDNTIYFNDYDNLTTYAPQTPYFTGLTFVNPYTTNNEGSGHVYGFETSATYTASRTLKFMGSYSFAQMDLSTSGNALPLTGTEQSLPHNMFSVRSYWNITPKVSFDNMLYYVDALQEPVDSYWRYDTRLAWQAMPGLELSLVGRNLLDDKHAEFPAAYEAEIERSVLASATWRF